jgi:hypothetical protein
MFRADECQIYCFIFNGELFDFIGIRYYQSFMRI